jgi:Stress responsive A/B Barrel Domain
MMRRSEMLYHTVLFQFPDDTSQDVIDDLLESHRELAEIPAVRSVVVGRNTMPVTDGWAWGMTIVFDDQKAMMEDFGPHPLHQKAFDKVKASCSRFMAMDLNTDPNEKGLRGDD